MDPLKYLEDVKNAKEIIKQKKRLIAQKYETLYGKAISYNENGTPNASGDNCTEKAIIRVLDYEEQVNQEIDKLMARCIEAEQIINKLPCKSHRELLERHYLLNEPMEKIAQEMHYSKQYLYKLRGVALLCLKKLLKDDNKCD